MSNFAFDDDNEKYEVYSYPVCGVWYDVIRQGRAYYLYATWSDGPVAVYDYIPSEGEITQVHQDYFDLVTKFEVTQRLYEALWDEDGNG